MIRRTLIGLAALSLFAVAAAGAIQPVRAVGPVDHISFTPPGSTNPGLIAPGGTLTPGVQVSVTLTALSGGTPWPGEQILLEFNHVDPSTSGGSAVVLGGPALSGASVSFPTNASGTITILYTPPNPRPINGRDVVFAQDAAVQTVVNSDAYDSSTVNSYTFNPSPIAAAGSLAAGSQVAITLTALDAGSVPVPSADILLSMSTTAASGGGTATATSTLGGARPIPATPTRFTADSNGHIAITYTAGSNISAGVDTITAVQHVVGPRVTKNDIYTAPQAQPGAYQAVTPFRLADTRSNSGQALAGQHLGAGQSDSVAVIGVDTVPSNATAVVLNVTVTNPTMASFLTVFPGPSLPLASNLNFVAGQTVANLVTVPIGPGGDVRLYNLAGTTDAVVDLEGYFAPQNGPVGLYNPLSPARIADTRPGSGQPNAGQTLSSGSVLRVQVTGAGGVPASKVSAVVLNVTATGPTGSSFLTAYPDNVTRPLASNLNFTAGQVVPNRVIVPVGSTGAIDVYNLNGQVDVVVDVGGWFTDTSLGGTGKRFTPINPTRVADTRPGSGLPLAGMTLGQGFTDAVSMSPAGAPAVGAVAVAANVTVADGTASSYLTAFPDGTGRPLASDLNWVHNQVVPNLVVTTLGSGVLDLYNNAGSVDAIVDVFGFWS